MLAQKVARLAGKCFERSPTWSACGLARGKKHIWMKVFLFRPTTTSLVGGVSSFPLILNNFGVGEKIQKPR